MSRVKLGRAYVLALGMLTVLASGCSAGEGTAGGPENSRVSVVRSKLDGVRFDVRRDPG